MKNWKLLLVFGLIATLFVFAGCIAGTTTPEETPTATATATATESATPASQVNVTDVPHFDIWTKGANATTYSVNGDEYINKAEADNGVKLISSGDQPTAESVEVFIDGVKIGDAEVTNGTWEYTIKAADWGSDGTKTISVRYVYAKKASYSNFATQTVKVDTTAPTLSSAKVVEGIKGGLSNDNIYWISDANTKVAPDNAPNGEISVAIVDKTLVQDAMWTFTTYGSGGDTILKITKTDASGVSIITADYNLSQAWAVQNQTSGIIELPHTIMQGMIVYVDASAVVTLADYGKLWSKGEKRGYIEASFSENVSVDNTALTSNIEGAAYNVVADLDGDGTLDLANGWNSSPTFGLGRTGKTIKWTDVNANYLWGKSGKYYVLEFSFRDAAGNTGSATSYGYVLTQ